MNQENKKVVQESATKDESIEHQGFFYQFWHNESFGRAAIQFGRVLNYVYLITGIGLLLLAISWGDFIWGLVAISWVFASVANIKKVNKRKHDRLYTMCPQCNKDSIKIGTQFCPDCGTAIPVQSVEADDLETAGREEGELKTLRTAAYGDSLNRKKTALLCTIIVGLLLGVFLIYTLSASSTTTTGKSTNSPESQAETISAGYSFSTGLKSNGTVVTAGLDWWDKLSYEVAGWTGCDAETWTDIVSVTAGATHIVGLKSDGTIEATGMNDYGQCDVEHWTDIVAISAGSDHTVGLKSDGTVVASELTGFYDNYQCQVESWTDIVAVSAGKDHTLGLKSDGTVVFAGFSSAKTTVEAWTNIEAISTGNAYSLGLKSDGTVVAAGANDYGQCETSSWTNIVAISAGHNHAVGLKSNGTVVAVGMNQSGRCEVSTWTDIVAISAGGEHTIGLKSDGTVVAVGYNQAGQCEVSDWANIMISDK